MAPSSKKKIAKSKNEPGKRTAVIRENPDGFYDEYPSWIFHTCDKEHWSINSEEVQSIFMECILPVLQSLETCKWKEIFLNGKKKNHSNDTEEMTPIARKRLDELHIECESLYSLRINGTQRIYGYMSESNAFCILWIDLHHGDNDTCVFRSKKKHT